VHHRAVEIERVVNRQHQTGNLLRAAESFELIEMEYTDLLLAELKPISIGTRMCAARGDI
jgi:hypothetical protein